MKTITEYQPLIFAEIISHSNRRRKRRTALTRALSVGFPIAYVALGLKITADTGVGIWDPRFWVMFVPLFVLGELLLKTISEGSRTPRAV